MGINTDLGPIPTILSDYTTSLGEEVRSSLERDLMGRGSPAFPNDLKEQLAPSSPSPSGDHYNTSLVNAVVLFVGATSVAHAKARTGSSLFSPSDPGPQLFLRLASGLDVEGSCQERSCCPLNSYPYHLEGQHHLMSSVVMHLRYPNAHTQWFSSLVLFLFAEVKTDMFQEITTKVLLERFVVHRPHPWGAILTFIELLRNSKYDFWSHSFVHTAPEITALLESVRN